MVTEYYHGPHKLLDKFQQVTVMQILLNKPSMYQTEVCDELFKATGREVHPPTIICRTIHSFGFTRQKLRKVALQQSEEKCRDFDFLPEITCLFDWTRLVLITATEGHRNRGR